MRIIATAIEPITEADLFGKEFTGDIWYHAGARGEVLSYSASMDQILVALHPAAPGRSYANTAYRIKKSQLKLEIIE